VFKIYERLKVFMHNVLDIPKDQNDCIAIPSISISIQLEIPNDHLPIHQVFVYYNDSCE
jgi:hypothetical protein